MTGFPYVSTADEVENDGNVLNQVSELSSSKDDADFSFLEADDFDLSVYFADSVLNFDCSRCWIEEDNTEIHSMDDIKTDRVGLSAEELGIGEKCIGKNTPLGLADSRAVPAEACSSGEDASRIVEMKKEISESRVYEEINVEDPIAVQPENIEETQGCLINEEFVKVCLNDDNTKVNSEGVSTVRHIDEQSNATGCREMMHLDRNETSSERVRCINDKAIHDNGIVSLDGVNTVDSVSVDRNTAEIVATKESEDYSDASSSESSSGDEDNDDDDSNDSSSEEEEDDDEDEMEKLERGEVDVEEGEIRNFDADEMVSWTDDEADVGESVTAGPIRSKNEVKDLPHVPRVNVTLEPYHQMLPVGIVLSIIEAQVIVEGMENHNPLNEGSILWITEKRSPLGLVDEIFGPVKNPYYIVRYNSASEVPAGIHQGTLISFVPEFANHVLNDQSLYKKGYDASGENDEELSGEAEFSDDEKEAEHKKMLKMAKRGGNDQKFLGINHQQPGNRKNDGKKFKHHGRNWKNNQASPTGKHMQQPNEQCLSSQPRPAQVGNRNFSTSHGPAQGSAGRSVQVDNTNFSNSLGPVQGIAGGQGPLPSFPQVPHGISFVPSNGVWSQGVPCQQQTDNMGFLNGFPTNAMPMLQMTQLQQPYQMPVLGGVPFQQPVNSSQVVPSNFSLPAGPSNFSCTPPFGAPMQFGQIGGFNFNQPPQFVMGLQGQHTASLFNVQGQAINSNVLPVDNSSNLQPQPFTPASDDTSRGFRGAAPSVRGRKCHRGGGRFRGGRGRQQFNGLH